VNHQMQNLREEHSEEWLKFFSQEAETEMTAALERSRHIQHASWTDGGAYQPGEQLEEVGDMPTQEGMTEINM
jgi:hypothetical protein